MELKILFISIFKAIQNHAMLILNLRSLEFKDNKPTKIRGYKGVCYFRGELVWPEYRKAQN